MYPMSLLSEQLLALSPLRRQSTTFLRKLEALARCSRSCLCKLSRDMQQQQQLSSCLEICISSSSPAVYRYFVVVVVVVAVQLSTDIQQQQQQQQQQLSSCLKICSSSSCPSIYRYLLVLQQQQLSSCLEICIKNCICHTSSESYLLIDLLGLTLVKQKFILLKF